MLRSVFFGTPEIAIPALRCLAARTQVTCVVTQPDRPAGRGNVLTPPPIKRVAQELGLPIWQPETLKGQAHAAELQGADLFVVMAYGEIMRDDVLRLPRECINLHGSLLPRWRGASPLQAVIRAGDTATGITVMRMVRALDAGPMFLQRALPLDAQTSLPALHDRMADLAADALGDFLDLWPKVSCVEQDSALVTVCRKLTSADGEIDWSQPARAIERWIRAYTPAPGCWTTAGSERWKILAATVGVEACPTAPGTARVDGHTLSVACGDGGWLVIERLQVPGGKPLAAADFLNGRMPPERFATGTSLAQTMS